MVFGFVFIQHQPAWIVDINFVWPKHGQEDKENGTPCQKQQRIEPPSYEEQKAFIEGIQWFEPKAGILTATVSKPSMPDLVKIQKRLPATVASLWSKICTNAYQKANGRMWECFSFENYSHEGGSRLPGTIYSLAVWISIMVWTSQRSNNCFTLWFSVPH